MREKPTIILAAHGSREATALATFRRFDTTVRQAFPEHPVIWTFAGYILRKLHAAKPDGWCANIHTAQALHSLHLTSAVVQPLFIAPGPLEPAFDKLGLPVGHALLDQPEHIDQVAAILDPQIMDPDTAYILCGHGSKKHPERNRPLIELHTRLNATHPNLFLATLDGPPGHDEPLQRIRASGFKTAHFIPVMFASGMHVRSDILGDGPDSWNSRLGVPAGDSAPLGDNPQIVQLFIDRIRHMLANK